MADQQASISEVSQWLEQTGHADQPLGLDHDLEFDDDAEVKEAPSTSLASSEAVPPSPSVALQSSLASEDLAMIQDMAQAMGDNEAMDALKNRKAPASTEPAPLAAVRPPSDSAMALGAQAGAADVASPPVQAVLDASGPQDQFPVRWFKFQNETTPLLCQNANGPCPLLAVCNVLFLRHRLILAPSTPSVSFEHLVQLLSSYLLDEDTSSMSEEERVNREAAMMSLMDRFPKLLRGLDVNPRFSKPDAFEFTPELAVFDLFHVPLYHGWLVDPQEKAVHEKLAHLTYNQAVSLLADSQSDEASLLVTQWLDDNSSQLSYHGLAELNQIMPEQGLAIFFRNNHFNVLHKNHGDLLLLVTDAAFASTSAIWETLINIENDGAFLSDSFQMVEQHESVMAGDAPSSDEALARQLQDLEYRQQNTTAGPATQAASPHVGGPVSDADLARQLQAQENAHAQRIAAQQQQQQQQQRAQSTQHQHADPHTRGKNHRGKSNTGCIIS